MENVGVRVFRSALWLLTLISVSVSVHAANGSYHICTDEKGRKLFSQTPCPEGHDAAVKEYKIKQPVGGEPSSVATPRVSYEELRDSNRKYELQRLLKRNRQKIKKLQDERDREIKRMRKELMGIAGPNANNRAVDYLEKIEKRDRSYMEEISSLKKTIYDQEKELEKLD